MSARRARRRAPLLRRTTCYHFNGLWPQKVLLLPRLTGREVLRRTLLLAVGAPLALILGTTLLAAVLEAYPPLLLVIGGAR